MHMHQERGIQINFLGFAHEDDVYVPREVVANYIRAESILYEEEEEEKDEEEEEYDEGGVDVEEEGGQLEEAGWSHSVVPLQGGQEEGGQEDVKCTEAAQMHALLAAESQYQKRAASVTVSGHKRKRAGKGPAIRQQQQQDEEDEEDEAGPKQKRIDGGGSGGVEEEENEEEALPGLTEAKVLGRDSDGELLLI